MDTCTSEQGLVAHWENPSSWHIVSDKISDIPLKKIYVSDIVLLLLSSFFSHVVSPHPYPFLSLLFRGRFEGLGKNIEKGACQRDLLQYFYFLAWILFSSIYGVLFNLVDLLVDFIPSLVQRYKEKILNTWSLEYNLVLFIYEKLFDSIFVWVYSRY